MLLLLAYCIIAFTFFILKSFGRLFQGFCLVDSYSLMKMSEEIREVKVAQRGVGLGGSLRVRREKRVCDQGGDEGVTVLDAITCAKQTDSRVHVDRTIPQGTSPGDFAVAVPCCWRLKCKPCGGLVDLRAFALSTIRGIVFVNTCSLSARSRSLSRKVANSANKLGSCTSSSGSRLMLNKAKRFFSRHESNREIPISLFQRVNSQFYL